MRPFDWFLLIGGALMLVFLSATVPAYANDCMIDCTGTTWELHYQGHVVSFGDMNLEECESLKAEIEAQTEPFTDLICVEVSVKREEI